MIPIQLIMMDLALNESRFLYQERSELEAALNRHAGHTEDVPIIIGGKEYRTDDVRYQVMVRCGLGFVRN